MLWTCALLLLLSEGEQVNPCSLKKVTVKIADLGSSCWVVSNCFMLYMQLILQLIIFEQLLYVHCMFLVAHSQLAECLSTYSLLRLLAILTNAFKHTPRKLTYLMRHISQSPCSTITITIKKCLSYSFVWTKVQTFLWGDPDPSVSLIRSSSRIWLWPSCWHLERCLHGERNTIFYV